MRARKILLLDNAKRDLRNIRRQIYQVSASRQVADNYLKRIRKGLRHLEYTSEACTAYRLDSGAETGYRFCPVEHYVAFFTLDEDTVYVDRILSSRQDYGRALMV